MVTSAQHPISAQTEEVIDDVRHLRTRLPPGLRSTGVREWALMRALYDNLNETILREHPDVIHAHSPVLVGLPALAAARRNRLPFVYEVRDLWENASVDRGKFAYGSTMYQIARSLESFVLRQADAVVTICETLRNELSERVNPRAQVHVVDNGVELDQFTPREVPREVLLRYGLTGSKLLGYVGTFQPYEGLSTLLDAVASIVSRVPDTQLFITGSGSEEPALKAKVERLGLGKHVVFTGRVPHDEVKHLYSAADIMVYPRNHTRTTALTTPLKPLEAMAMAKPVIVSNVPAMLELVRPDLTGSVFRAGDAADLARTCVDLLKDEPRRHLMGQRARQWVMSERDWAPLVARYRGIYRQALLNRPLSQRSATLPAFVSPETAPSSKGHDALRAMIQ